VRKTLFELGQIVTYLYRSTWLAFGPSSAYGLRLLIGIPWAQHVSLTLLLGRSVRQLPMELRRWDHPAAFAYQWFLQILYGGTVQSGSVLFEGVDGGKRQWSRCSCKLCQLPLYWVSKYWLYWFLMLNVYLHRESSRRYLPGSITWPRINLSAERVWCWFDPRRSRGPPRFLAKVVVNFEMGAAGTVVFFPTDEWFTGGFAIQDWAFGLVDHKRLKKPAFHRFSSITERQCCLSTPKSQWLCAHTMLSPPLIVA